MGAERGKTVIFGASLLTVIVVLHFIVAMVMGGAGPGFAAALLALVALAIVAGILVAVFALLTRAKEKLFSGFMFALVILLAAGLIERMITPAIVAVFPALSGLF